MMDPSLVGEILSKFDPSAMRNEMNENDAQYQDLDFKEIMKFQKEHGFEMLNIESQEDMDRLLKGLKNDPQGQSSKIMVPSFEPKEEEQKKG